MLNYMAHIKIPYQNSDLCNLYFGKNETLMALSNIERALLCTLERHKTFKITSAADVLVSFSLGPKPSGQAKGELCRGPGSRARRSGSLKG